MSEMVERVAKAIFPFGGGTMSWDEAKEEDREYVRQEARAAIEAMREPTDAMVSEGAIYSDDNAAYRGWEAMIDAALRS